MPISAISVSHIDGLLRPSPIPVSWVLQGEPSASNRVVRRSEDRMATTLVWDCTAGSFNWFYEAEETIYVLEGTATLTFGGAIQYIGPGSVVVFPAGCEARWDIETYIRKLAVFRHTVPQPLSLCVRAWRRLFAVMSASPRLPSPATA